MVFFIALSIAAAFLADYILSNLINKLFVNVQSSLSSHTQTLLDNHPYWVLLITYGVLTLVYYKKLRQNQGLQFYSRRALALDMIVFLSSLSLICNIHTAIKQLTVLGNIVIYVTLISFVSMMFLYLLCAIGLLTILYQHYQFYIQTSLLTLSLIYIYIYSLHHYFAFILIAWQIISSLNSRQSIAKIASTSLWFWNLLQILFAILVLFLSLLQSQQPYTFNIGLLLFQINFIFSCYDFPNAY